MNRNTKELADCWHTFFSLDHPCLAHNRDKIANQEKAIPGHKQSSPDSFSKCNTQTTRVSPGDISNARLTSLIATRQQKTGFVSSRLMLVFLRQPNLPRSLSLRLPIHFPRYPLSLRIFRNPYRLFMALLRRDRLLRIHTTRSWTAWYKRRHWIRKIPFRDWHIQTMLQISPIKGLYIK